MAEHRRQCSETVHPGEGKVGESVSPELTRKSVELAGLLLEYGGISQQGKGAEAALNLIKSGAADKKFRQIIELQGGDPNIKPEDVKLGQYTHVVESEETGRIDHINNRGITAIARAAGNPKVHEAGMYLHVEEGDKIKKGQGLFTLYANTERKLDQALAVYEKYQPIRMARIILEID